MLTTPTIIAEDYWENFQVNEEDIEFIYSYLLDIETPLTPDEIIRVLIEERIQRETRKLEEKRLSGGEIYVPEKEYEVGQGLVFPRLGWIKGTVIEKRKGINPDYPEFEVIKVELENGEKKEFAGKFPNHKLNDPSATVIGEQPDPNDVYQQYREELTRILEDSLHEREDFVRIAGRWFPRALLVDVNQGHLNLAEALLDMAGGGPLPTSEILKEVELGKDENPKLVEFSMDLAMQEDPRFDEVGPAGKVLWYLNRLEPDEVRNVPQHLKYYPVDYDRDVLTDEMIALEQSLDDELSPGLLAGEDSDEITVRLIYPHLRSGTLPLTPRVQPFFPTAYESPRIRFMLVDGESGDKFPGWVVRQDKYIYGLREWYEERGLIPGSYVRIRKSEVPGEVIVNVDTQRSRRDWLRTVLVGTDGGLVFAMLKQIVTAAYDERMAIAIPDQDALDQVWELHTKKNPPFERDVVNIVRELTKLNPQGHVHVAELYAGINLIRRCPPGPIMWLLASRPWFIHVGDLHFRFDDSEDVGA